MKISKRRLKRLIKEEFSTMLGEIDMPKLNITRPDQPPVAKRRPGWTTSGTLRISDSKRLVAIYPIPDPELNRGLELAGVKVSTVMSALSSRRHDDGAAMAQLVAIATRFGYSPEKGKSDFSQWPLYDMEGDRADPRQSIHRSPGPSVKSMVQDGTIELTDDQRRATKLYRVKRVDPTVDLPDPEIQSTPPVTPPVTLPVTPPVTPSTPDPIAPSSPDDDPGDQPPPPMVDADGEPMDESDRMIKESFRRFLK